jgi:hypothetical protein
VHIIVFSDAFPEGAAADDLLFGWRELLQPQAFLSAQFPRGSFQYNVEMFS